MTTLSNPRAGAHGFDEFAAVIEGDLLRAAWLLTADRVRATEVTEAALGRVLAGWSRHRDDRPVQQAYAALLEAAGRKPAPEAAVVPVTAGATGEPGDQVRRRQLTTEKAFRSLPAADRNAVVLHRYCNLSSRRVADLLHLTPTQVEQRSETALSVLRDRSTDLAELPFDSVPTPCAGADPARVAEHAKADNRVSRRRMLGWTAATGALGALGFGTWWLRRPFIGDATLGDSLLPARARATGQLFLWLQGRPDAPFGVGTTSNGVFAGDQPPSRVVLSRPSGSGPPQVHIDNDPVHLQRSAWGDYTAALPPVQYEDGQPLPVTLVVAQVPSDTDVCWPASSEFALDQADTSGIELRDHSTYAVSTVVGVSDLLGMVWRTASQQVGVNTGERAALAVHQQFLLFVLPGVGLWGAINAEQWLTARNVKTTYVDTQLDPQGWSFLALLPDGARAVRATPTAHYPDATVVVVPIDGTKRSIVVARSLRDLEPGNGGIPGVVDHLTWVGADGRPGAWTRPPDETSYSTGPAVDPAVMALPNARRTRRNAGPI